MQQPAPDALRDRPATFLFLQGIATPFFSDLGKALRARGHTVRRINLCPGRLAVLERRRRQLPRPPRGLGRVPRVLPDPRSRHRHRAVRRLPAVPQGRPDDRRVSRPAGPRVRGGLHPPELDHLRAGRRERLLVPAAHGRRDPGPGAAPAAARPGDAVHRRHGPPERLGRRLQPRQRPVPLPLSAFPQPSADPYRRRVRGLDQEVHPARPYPPGGGALRRDLPRRRLRLLPAAAPARQRLPDPGPLAVPRRRGLHGPGDQVLRGRLRGADAAAGQAASRSTAA